MTAAPKFICRLRLEKTESWLRAKKKGGEPNVIQRRKAEEEQKASELPLIDTAGEKDKEVYLVRAGNGKRMCRYAAGGYWELVPVTGNNAFTRTETKADKDENCARAAEAERKKKANPKLAELEAQLTSVTVERNTYKAQLGRLQEKAQKWEDERRGYAREISALNKAINDLNNKYRSSK